jgi:hypothetical protein
MEGLGEETITTFTQAVKRTFDLAMARLPKESHAHLERAHALVIHRHVFPTDDGRHAQVLSSDGARWYPVNGHCTCMDATRAPQGLCKHRLAFGLYRRASELLASSTCGVAAPAQGAALPEAPASVNVRVKVGGHECQWTLRDTDEARLAGRLEALLTRYPEAVCAQAKEGTASAKAPSAGGTPGETPMCPYHGSMRESSKVKGTWYCPSRMGDGTFCKEKFPKK